MKWLSPRQLATCLYKAAVTTIHHDGIEHAGYLAFLGLLALFPFLVFMVAVIGVIGQGEAGTHLINSVFQVLPDKLTVALKPRIVEIVSGPPQGLLTVSILGAIWTASSAVEGFRTILNRAYHVHTPPAYLLRRTLSIAQFLIFTFVTVFAMILVVVLQLLLGEIAQNFGIHISPEMQDYWKKIMVPVSMGILFIAISAIYYMLPNIKQRFVSVAPGALIVVVGWLASAWLFTLYLSDFNQVNLIYGSLGGFIAALIFFYVCNIIFIFGAEFNYQVVNMLGLRIVEREHGSGTDDIILH